VEMSGSARTISIINLRNAANIVITLHDADDGAPLPGGGFQVVADLDGNEARGPKDALVATCTSDASGACPLVDGRGAPTGNVVPLGQYIVQQVQAPNGYAPADAVAFELAQAGETADLAFTNGTKATAVLSLGGGRSAPVASVFPTDAGGGFFGPLANGLRWFAKNFWQMLLLGSSLALFGSPLWQSWRRRLQLSVSYRNL